MYVCICVCIHVRVCHAYIVCHEYIDTCIYVLPVHLDIILLVISDGDDSTEFGKCLFENPGVIDIHELHEIFVHSGRKNQICCFGGTKNRGFETKGVDQFPPRGPLPEWEWNGN